ncbi:MAG: sporulation protein YabP [Clostridia bacterium]|nr:sporulation protein YabP [Clostridia bacterium]
MAEIQKSVSTGVKKHSLQMANRESLYVSGVEDVVSFDEACIVLSTVCGIMSVDGSGMHILSLDTDKGDVEISGSVNGIIYPEGAVKGGGIFRKRQR